jgi:hypothetical protein
MKKKKKKERRNYILHKGRRTTKDNTYRTTQQTNKRMEKFWYFVLEFLKTNKINHQKSRWR